VASPGKKAFLLRVDPELWAELERLAAAELRSVNGQIEYLLREAVTKRKGKASSMPAAQPKEVRLRRRAGGVG
jgi:hypothetical protein